MDTNQVAENIASRLSTADLMDCIRDNAQNLSDAIKQANKHGLNVSIEKAPEGSDSLIQIIYSV